MFTKSFALICTLGAAAVCAAQTNSAATPIKHYRLSFVVSYAGSSQPIQSFTIDVPVAPGHPGISAVSFASSLTGGPSPEHSTWQCSDVKESPTGLALKIDMTSDSEAPAIPGLVSARHSHGAFQRQVDLVLNKATVVTKEMHVVPLGNTDPALAAAVARPAPQITVTATEI